MEVRALVMATRRHNIKEGGKYGQAIGMAVASAPGAAAGNPVIWSMGAMAGGVIGRQAGRNAVKAYYEDLQQYKRQKRLVQSI